MVLYEFGRYLEISHRFLVMEFGGGVVASYVPSHIDSKQPAA